MNSTFDIVKEIRTLKRFSVINDTKFSELYKPFIINRLLSFDCRNINVLSILNEMPGLSNELQYLFLCGTIESGKNFLQWKKQDSSKLKIINAIQDYYGVNHNIAKQYMTLLDEESINEIVLSFGDKQNE